MNISKIHNQIIKGSLTPLNLKTVTDIALHHMDNAVWGVKDVEAFHVNTRGWNAIGYNYWIGFDGIVYEGRGLNLGAHITGHNSNTIGIGFQGNYQSGSKVPLSTMTDVQFNAGIELIEWLKSKIPTITKVAGHKDYEANACPGDTFPLAEMVSGIKRGGFPSSPSVNDVTNELMWRNIITDQDLWNEKGSSDNDIHWLFIKYYPYIIKNGGSVKQSISNSDDAIEILQKQNIISDYEKWKLKANNNTDIFWLLVKMADYIN